MEKKDERKLSKLLSDLKKDYLESLPSKIQKLKALTETEQWPELTDEYHKLKGTGKTYGLPEISVLCEQLEILSAKKETQKKTLFLEAVELIEEIRNHALRNEKYDLSLHPLSKTILHTGKIK